MVWLCVLGVSGDSWMSCFKHVLLGMSHPDSYPIGYESGGDPEHAHETQNTLESLSQLAWEHDLDQW